MIRLFSSSNFSARFIIVGWAEAPLRVSVADLGLKVVEEPVGGPREEPVGGPMEEAVGVPRNRCAGSLMFIMKA